MSKDAERRKVQRHRVLKGGKLFYKNFAVSMDCTIRDESEQGMQIAVDPSFFLPPTLSILNRKDGKLAEAKVIWQSGEQLGLKFTSKMEDVRTFARADIRRMSIIATRG